MFVDGVATLPAILSTSVHLAAAARAAGSVALPPRWLEPAWLPEQRLGLLNDMFAAGCRGAAHRGQGRARAAVS